jgi:uncharacterized membrane protein
VPAKEPFVPVTTGRAHDGALHPAHAFFIGATVPLALGAALSDWAYTSTYHVQWINFSSWLIVGGLVFCGAALVCSLIDLRRANRRGGRFAVSFLLILAMCVLGFVNALVHARDAWGTMPTGFILSLIVAVLACAAAAVGFSTARRGAAP